MILSKKNILVLSLFSIFLLNNISIAREVENIPMDIIIGVNKFNCSKIIYLYKNNELFIHPDNISLDLKNKNIIGLVAEYDKSVDLSTINNHIDMMFKKFKITNNDYGNYVSIWRIEQHGITIQLSVNNEKNVQIVILPFSTFPK